MISAKGQVTSAGTEEGGTGLDLLCELPRRSALIPYRSNNSNTMKKLITYAAVLCVFGWATAQAADVKENWEKSCKKCHGDDGKGETKMGQKAGVKDLTDPKVQADFTDEKAFKAIKEGIKDGDKTKMKPAEGLSDDEIKALVAHCRSFKK